MASAGTVTLDLDANSVKLLRELRKSQQATQRTANNMQQRMTRAFNTVRQSILSASAALAAFGAIRSFARIAGEIDQIGKLVDRLGGSTEAFSELQFVAERSGVAFNTLTMGLQRMQRRVAEAANGLGEAKAALKELGINARTLTQLSIDKQFETLADALANVATEGDRTRLAMKLFDSEGVALLQTMTNGAAGIRNLREEAKRLGVSLSTEQVYSATKANDAMTSLNASYDALGRTLAIKVAPWLASTADGLRRMFGGFSADEEVALFRNQLENLLASGLTLDDAAVRNTIDSLNAALAKQAESGFSGAGVDNSWLEEILLDEESLRQGQERINKLYRAYDRAAAAVARFREKYQMDQRAQNAKSVFQAASDDLDEYHKSLEKVEKQSTKLNAATQNMGYEFTSAFENAVVAGGKLQDVLKSLLAQLLQLAVRWYLSGGGSSFGGARAAGGPVYEGGSYLVGEKGPELFRPAQSGVIVPNHALKQGGSGTTIINNFQAGADVATIRSEIVPMLERTQQSAVNEVMQRKRQGLL